MPTATATDGRADRTYIRAWTPAEWREASARGGRQSGVTQRAKWQPQREEALRLVAHGTHPEDAARAVGVSRRTVSRWIKAAH